MDPLEKQLVLYRARHRTTGCKVTHMFGVPMIYLSFPMVLFNPGSAFRLFAWGWMLQFIGHAVFERNRPLFTEDPRNPYTYLAALFFVAGEWKKAGLTVLSFTSKRFPKGDYVETNIDADISEVQKRRA